ncbi:MAG: hypothetical protein ACSLFB_02575, partial [Acidimicrobiales bacterium]
RELRRCEMVVNVKRVRRLMRLHGMAGRFRRRRCQTTFPGLDGYVIPDLIGRAFAPGKPNERWVQDITYIPTGEGWLYLAGREPSAPFRLITTILDHREAPAVELGDAYTPALGDRDGLRGVVQADRSAGDLRAPTSWIRRLFLITDTSSEPPTAAM